MKYEVYFYTFWIFFVALLSYPEAYAQESDSKKSTLINNKYRQIAQNLEKLYQNGELEEVITIFKQSCLVSTDDRAKESKEFGKVKSEFRADIYSIVSRAYVALDQPQLADRFLSKLFAIRVDEDFQEYWQAIKETKEYDYYVAPRLQVGGTFGGNYAIPTSTESFYVFNTLSNNNISSLRTEYYGLNNIFKQTEVLGARFGLQLIYALTPRLSVSPIIAFSSVRFGYIDQFTWIDSPNPAVRLSIRTERNSFHTINYLDIPFYLRYQLAYRHKLKPYVLFGAFYNTTISGSKAIDLREFPAVEVNGQRTDFFGNASNAEISITNLLNRNYYGFVGGAGLNYAYQYFRFSFSVTYRYGINNIINPANRYNNQDLVFGYHDIFDNINLNQLNFQFGVAYTLSHKAFRK
jgi:hypothetical protein